LDVTHFGLLKMEGPQPDLLILPSKLRHFSKVGSFSPFFHTISEQGADGRLSIRH
jgi:hypothetical protein